MNLNNTYEQDTELKNIILVVLQSWRNILFAGIGFAIIIGGISGGITAVKQSDTENAQSVQTSYQKDLEAYERNKAVLEQEIENLSNEITKQQEYLEQSALMNMSPYNINEARVDLFIKTDYEIMPGMMYQNINYTETILQTYKSLLLSPAFLSEVQEKIDINSFYLKELITVECGNALMEKSGDQSFTNLITIKVWHTDVEMAEKILHEIENNINQIKAAVNDSIGEHTVSIINESSGVLIDLSLSNKQKSEHERLEKLHASLQEKETEDKSNTKPIEPDVGLKAVCEDGLKFGFLGGILGVFLAMAAAIVSYLMSDKLRFADELRKKTQIRVIGVLDISKKSAFDYWIRRWGGKQYTADKDNFAFIVATLEADMNECKNILVTGAMDVSILTSICQRLKEETETINIIPGANILKDASTIKMMGEYDGVVLVEQTGVSTHSILNQEINMINNMGKKLLGCIILD